MIIKQSNINMTYQLYLLMDPDILNDGCICKCHFGGAV